MRSRIPGHLVSGIFVVFVCALATGQSYAQVPANAHVVGGQWFCDNGFRRVGDHCEKVIPPPNAHVTGGEWFCDNGFKRVADRCERVIAPPNAHVTGGEWFCDNGFRRVGDACERVVAPANAHVTGGQWFCDNGFRRVGNRCEQVVAPPNAHVTGGEWFCDNGFRRVGNGCVAVVAPSNAHVTGNDWFCDEGFKKANNRCVEMTPAEKEAAAKQAAQASAGSVNAYRSKVETEEGDILILRNGAVVEITSGSVGYVGYSKDAILFRTAAGWRIWIEGKRTYRCDVLKAPSGGATTAREVLISRVAADGEVLILNDGSVLRVDSIYTIYTGLWLGLNSALLLNESELINLDQGELIRVSRLR